MKIYQGTHIFKVIEMNCLQMHVNTYEWLGTLHQLRKYDNQSIFQIEVQLTNDFHRRSNTHGNFTLIRFAKCKTENKFAPFGISRNTLKSRDSGINTDEMIWENVVRNFSKIWRTNVSFWIVLLESETHADNRFNYAHWSQYLLWI